MSDIFLCPKCGYFKFYFDRPEICSICNENLIEITTLDSFTFAHMTELEAEQFAINYIGHDFDPELKMKRQNYERNRRAEIEEICQSPTITCPYCQSTNTNKITTTAKVVNTALFGWFGTKRLKEWYCNNCKSEY